MPAKKPTKKSNKSTKPAPKKGTVKKPVDVVLEAPIAPENSNILYSWQATEFEFREKGLLWYSLAGVALAAIVIYGIIVSNWLFPVVIFLILVLVLKHANENPGEINHEIRRDGVEIGTHYFPYENLKGFWIAENANKLYLISTHRLLGIVNFHLDGADIEQVRHTLGGYIPETSHTNEDFFDKVGRILKI